MMLFASCCCARSACELTASRPSPSVSVYCIVYVSNIGVVKLWQPLTESYSRGTCHPNAPRASISTLGATSDVKPATTMIHPRRTSTLNSIPSNRTSRDAITEHSLQAFD
ncbi:hypothetical protein BD311DRAFT_756753 [Dichomitus squalens]|uniref:Uncharacterized protein n=1 Tax=Dichomitus squalens TaxID=114155 RepID=A0A4Q9MSD1_9APHY|nr:hypothetical protein BD311DRAFT_756753 [Dichomitus squalens]